MTRYTVTWTPDALDELAELWLSAEDRNAVTLATTSLDRELASAPAFKVTKLAEGLSYIDVPPLREFCIIREDDRLVEVVQVWLVGGPNGQRHRADLS
jgi:hypothetical protein